MWRNCRVRSRVGLSVKRPRRSLEGRRTRRLWTMPRRRATQSLRRVGGDVAVASVSSIAIGWHVGWPRSRVLCEAAAFAGRVRPAKRAAQVVRRQKMVRSRAMLGVKQSMVATRRASDQAVWNARAPPQEPPELRVPRAVEDDRTRRTCALRRCSSRREVGRTRRLRSIVSGSGEIHCPRRPWRRRRPPPQPPSPPETLPALRAVPSLLALASSFALAAIEDATDRPFLAFSFWARSRASITSSAFSAC